MFTQLLTHFDAHADAILGGDHSALAAPFFDGFSLHRSPNGSIVIALQPSLDTRNALASTYQHIDLFLLEPNARLGRHFHHHASAHIHILRGAAMAEVDGVSAYVAPGDTAYFPATKIHDVHAKHDWVLFASFQDHPILRNDGSVDYVAVED